MIISIMKNILSKIGKSLLIPALAFSINSRDANSQKLEFNPIVGAGIGTTNQSNFNVYKGWENHFKGLNGDEQLINKDMERYGDFKVGFDIGIKFDNLALGLSSDYSIAKALTSIPLAAIELHDWNFNYARINEFSLKQKTPSIGAYFRFPLNDDATICLRGSVREAYLEERKREDLYFAENSKCSTPRDDTDYLTQEFEKIKSKTLLNKIGLEVQISDENGRCGFEGFYETDWERVNIFGLNANVYFNLPKKKKD